MFPAFSHLPFFFCLLCGYTLESSSESNPVLISTYFCVGNGDGGCGACDGPL